jgi:hypothetical protein
VNPFRVFPMDLPGPEDPPPSSFARFNKCPHLCVEVPDGLSTISVRTSNGHMLTFAFCPYEDGNPPRCVDIVSHANGTTAKNGDRDVPTFPVAVRSGVTGGVLFSGSATATIPPTCVTIQIPDRPKKEDGK